MKYVRFAILALAFACHSPSALAQWQVPDHSVPIGRGGTATGFKNAAPGAAGQPLVSNGAAADPSFKLLPIAGGGTNVDNTGAATNDTLAYNGTGFFRTALTTLIDTVCKASPSACGDVLGYTSAKWWNVKCDGVTNDTVALQAAVTASPNKRLSVPAGICVVNAHINVSSNTTIAGAGVGVSTLKATGQDYIFRLDNVSNVTISDLYLLGTRTYTSWVSSPIGAIFIAVSTTQANLTFRNLKLEAFNATYWILGQQTSAAASNITFDNVYIKTAVGDVPADPDPANNTNYLLTLSSGPGGSRWENTTIRNSQIDQVGACFGIILFSDHYKYSITNNRILSPGGTNTAGHCTNGLGATNAYGILVYDLNADGNPPSNGLIADNYILNPIASGIYMVGDGIAFTRAANSFQTLVTGNVVVGQTHTDTLLARGGIAIGLATDISVVGNFLYNNQIGINLIGQSAGNMSVLSNHISSVAGSSIGISQASGANGSSNTDRRILRNNYIDTATSAMNFISSTGARFNFLDVSANVIIGVTDGISFANQWVTGVSIFTNNHVAGVSSFSGLTGPITLQNNSNLSFVASGLPAATNGSSVFVSDGAPASACTGASTGAQAFRQNNAWKCF